MSDHLYFYPPIVAYIVSSAWASTSRGPSAQAQRIKIGGVLSSFISLLIFSLCLRSGAYDETDSFSGVLSERPKLIPLFVINTKVALIGFSSSLMICAGVLASPARAFETTAARLILPTALTLFVALTANHILLGLGSIALFYLLLGTVLYRETSDTPRDEESLGRARIFALYQGIAIPALVVALLWNVFNIPQSVTLTPKSMITLSSLHLNINPALQLICLFASSAVIGVFPFHSWALAFFSSARINPLPPILLVGATATILTKYLPIAFGAEFTLPLFVQIVASIGLVSISLMLLVEGKLKRISALLYVIQISLLMIDLSNEGEKGAERLFLVLNILVANSGLAIAMSALSSRFGSAGLTSRGGLFSFMPEIGVCFLIYMLSLIGFPGTLGFIEGELLVDLVTGNAVVLTAVALAVAMNGYSVFRIFGRAFFGISSSDEVPDMPLAFGERVGLYGLVLLLMVNGIAPQFIVSFMQ